MQQRSHQTAGIQLQGRFLEQFIFTIHVVRNKLSTQKLGYNTDVSTQRRLSRWDAWWAGRSTPEAGV